MLVYLFMCIISFIFIFELRHKKTVIFIVPLEIIDKCLVLFPPIYNYFYMTLHIIINLSNYCLIDLAIIMHPDLNLIWLIFVLL